MAVPTGSVPVIDLQTIRNARRLLCAHCGGRVILDNPDQRVVDLVCWHCARTVGQVVMPRRSSKRAA